MSTLYTETNTYSNIGPLEDAFPHVIALTGFARSGKDTVAGILSRYGYIRLAVADPLREWLYGLNPVVSSDSYGRVFRVRDVVDDVGWDEAKSTFEVRALLQRIGEFGRELLGEDIWIETLHAKMDPHEKYVITDARFKNEVKYLKKRVGAVAVHVHRPGIGPVNGHISDMGVPLNLLDGVITNDRDVVALENAVAAFLDNWMLDDSI